LFANISFLEPVFGMYGQASDISVGPTELSFWTTFYALGGKALGYKETEGWHGLMTSDRFIGIREK
jgi:hypothetical protein